MERKISVKNMSGNLSNQQADSYFDGSLLTLIGVSLLAFLMTTLTLGVLYPWAVCLVFGWKINHTVIEGRRLKFIGRPMSLFLN